MCARAGGVRSQPMRDRAGRPPLSESIRRSAPPARAPGPGSEAPESESCQPRRGGGGGARFSGSIGRSERASERRRGGGLRPAARAPGPGFEAPESEPCQHRRGTDRPQRASLRAAAGRRSRSDSPATFNLRTREAKSLLTRIWFLTRIWHGRHRDR